MNKKYKNIVLFGSNSTCKDELTEKIIQELPYQELKTQIKFDDFKPTNANKTVYEKFLINYYMRLMSIKNADYGYVINDLDLSIETFTKYCLEYDNLIYCLGNVSTNSIDLAVKLKDEKNPSIEEMNDMEIIDFARKEILLGKKMKLECAKHNIQFYDVANAKSLVFNHITHDISENHEIKRSLSK